jgi:hypothetical protein
MKKLKIILIILILLNLKATSQTAYDSITCLPNSSLKTAINRIEEGKVAKKELDLSKDKIQVLTDLVAKSDSTISYLQKKDTINQKIIGGYKEAIKNLNVSISNSELMYHTQTLRLAKEKVKKWTFLGLGLSGIITLLIIK